MILKLFFGAIIAVIVSSLLKVNSKEFLLPFQLAAGIIFILYILNESNEYFYSIKNIIDGYSYLKSIISSLLKAGIISVITKLSCDICRENGNYFFEDVVEIGGRIMIFIITVPFITEIIEITAAFVK